jgi:hypothetical protein
VDNTVAFKNANATIVHRNRQDKKIAKEALREDWADEYKPRLELVDRMFKDNEVFPDGIGEKIWEARTADGHMLRHLPEVLKFFGDAAVDRYGDAGFISGDARQATSSVAEEARKIMKSDFSRYISEGWDKKLAEATAKTEKQGKRGRAA